MREGTGVVESALTGPANRLDDVKRSLTVLAPRFARWHGRDSGTVPEIVSPVPCTERGARMAKQQKKSPEKVFRIGHVSASIFLNDASSEGSSRSFRSVNVQRSYRDGDETKFSSSFTLADLPTAIRVMQLAQQYVEQAEAEVGG